MPKRAIVWLGLLMPPLAQAACPALLDHRYVSLQGKPVILCEFAGRPILVVNTASQCGYTPQFEKLEALNKRHQRRGLVVIEFPSNDFYQEQVSQAGELFLHPQDRVHDLLGLVQGVHGGVPVRLAHLHLADARVNT
jgi:hypothetical protein